MIPSAEVQLLTFDDVAKEVFTRWDITEHQVNQHLLNESLTGTPEIVADLLTFPPGFVHHMHRHPHADMIVVPLTGNLQFLGDFDRTEVLTDDKTREVKASLPTDLTSLYPAIQKQWDAHEWPWKN
jgi:hypothetical protein